MRCRLPPVSEGWVTLEGDVDHWHEREAADKAIRNLSGVAGIVNKLEVKPSVFIGDVRRSIEDALERRALREASHVQLELRDGRVNVTGTVGSWAEKMAILGAARGTTGVRGVDDHLRIE